MTKIVDTGIAVVHQDGEYVRIIFGADISFDERDVRAGQSGLVDFSISLNIWDEDSVLDDFVGGKSRVIEPGTVAPLVGIEFEVELSLRHLRLLELKSESRIELYGEFRLKKDGHVLGGVVNTKTIEVTIPSYSYWPLP